MSYQARFRIWRGDASGGGMADFQVEVNEGEVVLDIVHRLQATQALTYVIGSACAGALCTHAGPAWAMGADAASFAFSAASLLASVLVCADERIFSHAPEADFTRRYQHPLR